MATLVLDNTLYQGYATIAEQNNISVTDAMAEALRLLKQHLKKKPSLSLRQRLEKRILELRDLPANIRVFDETTKFWKEFFRKPTRPSLPLRKAPPLISVFSPSGKKRKTALRCSEPLRYKVGGASKPSPGFAGWDRLNCSSLQYRSALVVARMRNIIFILLLTGLPLGRYPSGLWRKSYDRHWHLMNDHNDRGCHL